jgi:hypothetical protein
MSRSVAALALLTVVTLTVFGALAPSAPAQNDLTREDCEALGETASDELAQACEEQLSGGSAGQAGPERLAPSPSGVPTSREAKEASSEPLSRTGFEGWLLLLAGAACVIGGTALWLRARRHARDSS